MRFAEWLTNGDPKGQMSHPVTRLMNSFIHFLANHLMLHFYVLKKGFKKLLNTLRRDIT